MPTAPRTAKKAAPRLAGAGELRDTELPGMPAGALASDPEPKPTKRSPGRPRGTSKPKPPAAPSQMTKSDKMELLYTEAYAIASLVVGAWEIKDPECAGVFSDKVENPLTKERKERLEAIVMSSVRMVARHDGLLDVLAKGGVLAEIAILGSYLIPVGKQLWKAHGPNGHGHAPAQEIQDDYARQYPAPALAPAFAA